MPKQAKGKTGSTRLRGDDRKFFWVGFGFGFFLGKSARFSGLAVAEADRLRPRLATVIGLMINHHTSLLKINKKTHYKT